MEETSLAHLVALYFFYDAGDGWDRLALRGYAVSDTLDVGGNLESQDILVVTIPVTFLLPSSHQTTLGVVFQFIIGVPFREIIKLLQLLLKSTHLSGDFQAESPALL